jgi:hypothetical protein
MLITVVIMLAFCAVAAATLRAVADRVVEIYLPFREAMWIAVVIAGTNYALFWMVMACLAWLVPLHTEVPDWIRWVGIATGLGLCLLADMFILVGMIKDPATRERIGYKSGLVIGAVLMAIFVTFQLAIVGILYIADHA